MQIITINKIYRNWLTHALIAMPQRKRNSLVLREGQDVPTESLKAEEKNEWGSPHPPS